MTLSHMPHNFSFEDAASLDAASHWPDVSKGPRDPEFLESFFEEHGVQDEDRKAMREWVNVESSRQWSEQFHKLLAVLRNCKIPAAVVFAAMVQFDNSTLLDLAEVCTVSKNGVHKHVLNQESVLGELKIRSNYRRYGFKIKQIPKARNRKAVDLLESVMDFSRDVKDFTQEGFSDANKNTRLRLLQIVGASLKHVEEIVAHEQTKN